MEEFTSTEPFDLIIFGGTGDLIAIDAVNGSLNLKTDKRQLEQRNIPQHDKSLSHAGIGRELFACFRTHISNAVEGGSIFLHDGFDLHMSGDSR